MADKTIATLKKSIPPYVKELLGPPPLLTTENEEIYYGTLACFAQEIGPTDMLAWLKIKDLADLRLEIVRWRRLKTCFITDAYERWIKQNLQRIYLEYQAKREELCKKAELEKTVASAKFNAKPAELEKRHTEIIEQLKTSLAAEEGKHANLRNAWKTRPATEADIARLTSQWIGDFEKIHRLLESAEKQFLIACRDLERHVHGFGKMLSENLKKTIEGEVVRVR